MKPKEAYLKYVFLSSVVLSYVNVRTYKDGGDGVPTAMLAPLAAVRAASRRAEEVMISYQASASTSPNCPGVKKSESSEEMNPVGPLRCHSVSIRVYQ